MLAIYVAAAVSDIRDVHCTGAASGDTARLFEAINASNVGDHILIHARCVVSDTICLKGDRTY